MPPAGAIAEFALPPQAATALPSAMEKLRLVMRDIRQRPPVVSILVLVGEFSLSIDAIVQDRIRRR